MNSLLVVIPCGQSKIWDKFPLIGPVYAQQAYTGVPFKINKEYAQRFATRWVILSAKYGFIDPNFIIPEQYNITFKKPSTRPVAIPILKEQIISLGLNRFDTVIGLGGKEYRAALESAFEGTNIPLHFPFSGLPIGKAMSATKGAISSEDPLFISKP